MEPLKDDHIDVEGSTAEPHQAVGYPHQSHHEEEEEESSEYFLALFLLISFGYMLPWTSLGALITYYKETYSASFYVKLYCAYYLPGLPIALLQYRFDPYFDRTYGSQKTYMVRGILSYIVMILILLSLIRLESRRALLCLFVSLGVFGWLCHGTASMLASMYPPSAIAYLQTGFRCPEIYTIVAVAILHLGKRATIPNLDVFYVCNGAMSLIGMIAWVTVVSSSRSKYYFDIKDNIIGPGATGTDIEERIPLMGEKRILARGEIGVGSSMSSGDSTPIKRQNGVEGGKNDSLQSSSYSNSSSSSSSNSPTAQRNGSSTVAVAVKTMDIGVPTPELPRTRSLNVRDSRDGNDNGSIADDQSDSMSRFDSYARARPVANSSRNHFLLQSAENAASFMVKIQNKKMSSSSSAALRGAFEGDGYSMSEELYQDVFPLCIALIVVMWCSIFQASFFAYVNSPDGREIEQILYFTRLFADLVGRPLTRLPRPYFIQTKNQLLIASMLRISLMVLFFVYILVPSFPKSDAFVTALVAIFSIMNGYFVVLIYEYAAVGRKKAEQTAATRLLNICFQLAAFTAVLMSVIITSLGWLDHVIPTVDDIYYDDQYVQPAVVPT